MATTKLMLEQLKSLQNSNLSNFKVCEAVNRADWHTVYEYSPEADHDYLPLYTDYHLEYLSSFGAVADLSVVFYSRESIPCGIWPLTVYKPADGDKYQLQSHVYQILPPIFCEGVSRKQVKKIQQQCINFINAVSSLDAFSPIQCEFDPTKQISWHRLLSPFVEDINYQQRLHLTLDAPANELVKGFRKSYRSLINQGKKLWQAEVIDELTKEQLAEIRQFHIDVAGRKTRSDKTWEYQKRIINSGYCFVVRLTDKVSSKLVGMAFFNVTKRKPIIALAYMKGAFFRPQLVMLSNSTLSRS